MRRAAWRITATAAVVVTAAMVVAVAAVAPTLAALAPTSMLMLVPAAWWRTHRAGLVMVVARRWWVVPRTSHKACKATLHLRFQLPRNLLPEEHDASTTAAGLATHNHACS